MQFTVILPNRFANETLYPGTDGVASGLKLPKENGTFRIRFKKKTNWKSLIFRFDVDRKQLPLCATCRLEYDVIFLEHYRLDVLLLGSLTFTFSLATTNFIENYKMIDGVSESLLNHFHAS